MDSQKKVFLFAAGGTGGHIFPALAIAESLKEKVPNAEICFVGTKRGLENSIVPNYSYHLHIINIGRLNSNVSILERLKTLLLLPYAFVQSAMLIIKLKPTGIIGVGGYASGPILLMAALMGKKTFIWEPNAYPGMANRYLSPFVNKAFVIFEETKKWLKTNKTKVLGYPLRKIFSQKFENKKFSKPLRVFIFGGSQGSRAINNILFELYKDVEVRTWEIEFVHQIGALDYSKFSELYKQLPEEIKSKIQIHEFIQDMPKYYNWAHFAICRAGMGTVAELSAMGVPALFVPLPNSADDHQLKNAESLVQRKAAALIRQSDLNLESLKSLIKKYLENPEDLSLMSQNMHSFHKGEASRKIVISILKEVGIDT